MGTSSEDARDKIRRTINSEFVRMEEDFDSTRTKRAQLADKLMEAVGHVKLLDDNGGIKEDTDTGIRLVSTALKALSDIEKAQSSAIMLKLKNQEQEIANSAAAKDRIAIILKATAPGKIEAEFPSDALEEQLNSMFDGEIQEYELKSSPRDLSDE